MTVTASSWRTALIEASRETGIEALTEVALGELSEHLPALATDPDLREAARTGAAANLALVLDLIAGAVALEDVDVPPQAAVFARELARRNVPVGALDRTYRLASLALWRWSVAELRERLDEDELAGAVEALSEAMLETGNAFSAAVMERYATEREQWRRSADAIRAATVQDILAGRSVDAAASSARLRYELRQNHQAFIVWSPVDVAESAVAGMVDGRALLWPTGRAVAGWCAAGTLDAGALDPSAHLALGTPGAGLEGFRASHAEAREARRVAELLGRPPGCTFYEDVALVALVTQDLVQARRFVRRMLGPLAEPDPAMRRLADTLQAVLEHQGSPRRAAEVLGVHENTVAKRLRNVDQLLGADARRRPAELLAALAVLDAMVD